jgi:serine/threonine-protein kinase
MADDKKQKTLFLDDAAVAAPPRPSQPVSSQSTMMLDAAQAPAQPQRQMVVPTMMKEPPRQQLPPMQRPKTPSTWGRWVAGPLLSVAIAIGTAYAAGIVMPAHPKGATPAGKPQGRLKINSTPPAVSILVDGKRHPHFTPTTVEADVGATLKLTFLSDGYQTKEEEVFVAEGEHPFNVKLEPIAQPTAPAPIAPAPTAAPKHEHHHTAAPKAAEPAGTATISVRVRPWAIVFVDKQRLKQTPIDQYQLPSGKHVIELVNEGKNRREKIEVTLKPGEEQEIHRDWEK